MSGPAWRRVISLNSRVQHVSQDPSTCTWTVEYVHTSSRSPAPFSADVREHSGDQQGHGQQVFRVQASFLVVASGAYSSPFIPEYKVGSAYMSSLLQLAHRFPYSLI